MGIKVVIDIPVKDLKEVARSAGYKIPKDFSNRMKSRVMQQRLSKAILDDWQLLNDDQDPGEAYADVFTKVLPETEES